MIVTSIELHNVRKFTKPTRIDGISAGLNVLSAPNEAGKSTFFEALHAVFFLTHRSHDKNVRALEPRIGGDPEVTVEFNEAGHSWKLRKVWSSAPSRKLAELWRNGVQVGQGEEAEDQLAQLMGGDSVGPAGLLWVRQGSVAMDKGGGEQAARRDIMTSVAGEVEAVTGGRRMEMALRACSDFLGLHLTATGKPKAGGDLKARIELVDSLAARCEALSAQVRDHQDDLNRRRKVRSDLADLGSPEDMARHQAALKAAEAVLQDAQKRESELEAAQGKVREAGLNAKMAAEQAEALRGLIDDRAEAASRLAKAQASEHDAALSAQSAQAAFDTAKARHKTAATDADTAARLHKAALQSQAVLATQDRRKDLQARLERAQLARETVESLRAKINATLSETTLRKLEKLAQQIAIERQIRDSSAMSFSIAYDAGAHGRVLWSGAAVVGDQAHPAPEGAVLDVQGVGRIDIRPGAGGSEDSVAEAETALADALSAAGVATLDAALASGDERVRLLSDLALATARLETEAPDGIEALRQAIAGLPKPVEIAADLPSVDQAEAVSVAADTKRDAATVTLEAAREALSLATTALADCRNIVVNATENTARIAKALTVHDDPEAVLENFIVTQATQVKALEQATAKLKRLQADAPDLGAAGAAVERARKVIDNARIETARLNTELARLTTRIEILASEGVEEDLAQVTEELTRAQERYETLSFDIKVMQRLERALNMAQQDANDRYVQPIHAELVPLLRMLWPDADPVIDPDTGMITAIKRRGLEEDFSILSGGTQEQITLMVRLAFAKMLAKGGRAAPVILDDAIVYTDDDRIDQMFNALNKQSQDLQIIVFSCRQRAFRELGGDPLTIAQDDVA